MPPSEEKGHRAQVIGRSRGGWTTKVHVLTDVVNRPYALMLSAGNVSDVTAAPALLERAKPMRYLVADKGYDADHLRRALRAAGTTPVIPGRRNRKRPIRHDRRRYRGRHLIKNAFCRLKDFRRIATRYDKLAANFLSSMALVTAVAFWLRTSLSPRLCSQSLKASAYQSLLRSEAPGTYSPT